MNGRQRVAMQMRSGVRDLVEEIDALKILLGISNVKLLTPKAEVTLRKGEKARIPLGLSCGLVALGIEVSFVFPIGYPDNPFEVQKISFAPNRIYDEEERARVHELCSNVEYRETNGVSSSVAFINYIRNLSNFGNEVLVEGTRVDADEKQDDEEAELTEPVVEKVAEHMSYRSFSCRKCRKALFTDYDLDEHNRQKTCQTLFLSDPAQSSETASEAGGKITCPNCSAKLGAWSWVGTQCSCALPCICHLVSVLMLSSSFSQARSGSSLRFTFLLVSWTLILLKNQ